MMCHSEIEHNILKQLILSVLFKFQKKTTIKISNFLIDKQLLLYDMMRMKKDAIQQLNELVAMNSSVPFNPEPKWPNGDFEMLAKAGISECQS